MKSYSSSYSSKSFFYAYPELALDRLEDRYSKSASVKNKIAQIQGILRSCRIKASIANKITTKLAPLLVPAGVKSSIKGNIFNQIVEKEIKKIRFNRSRYKIHIEKSCKHLQEKPDWMIEDTVTGRILVGYNQLDLWSGGHQINRAGKYILDDTIHQRLARKKIQMVCVVYSEFPSTSAKSNSCISKILRVGTTKSRLVYPTGLANIISTFIVNGPGSRSIRHSKETQSSTTICSK
jgi:hypothetical protein